uniref:Uncharacterized protein n=1 Tax=Arundo donax TaxID=35708 RepID=A0A0A9DJZ8_ARUDO
MFHPSFWRFEIINTMLIGLKLFQGCGRMKNHLGLHLYFVFGLVSCAGDSRLPFLQSPNTSVVPTL